MVPRSFRFGRAAIGLVFATMALMASAQTYTAKLNVGGFISKVDFVFTSSSQTSVTVETAAASTSVPYGTDVAWVIHEFSVNDSGDSSTLCSEDVVGGVWDPANAGSTARGFIIGHDGPLTPGTKSFDQSPGSIMSSAGVAGRALVLHRASDNAPLYCANFGERSVSAVSTAFTDLTHDSEELTFVRSPTITQVPGATSSVLQYTITTNAGPSAPKYTLEILERPCSAEGDAPPAIWALSGGITFTDGKVAGVHELPDVTKFFGRSVVFKTTTSPPVVLQCKNFAAASTSTVEPAPRDYKQATIQADFVTGAMQGSIMIQQVSDEEVLITTNVQSLSPTLTSKGALWHVHEFAAGTDQTACGPAVTGGHWDPTFLGMADPDEVGNLSGRHGLLTLGERVFSDKVLAAPNNIWSSRGIFGRSIVIHVNDPAQSNPRVSCGTIGSQHAVALQTAAFTPIVRSTLNLTVLIPPRIVQLPRLADGAHSTPYVQFSFKNTGTAEAKVSITLNKGKCKETWSEDDAALVLDRDLTIAAGATQNTVGETISVIYGYGRSLSITASDDAGTPVQVQCQNLSPTAGVAEPERDYTAPIYTARVDEEDVEATFTFQRVSATEVLVGTSVMHLGGLLATEGALWHVHEFAAGTDQTACGPTVTGGHWDPTFLGMANPNEVGNLSGRHGKLLENSNFFSDSTLGEIVGQRGIVGRSVVIHRNNAGVGNPRVACATIGEQKSFHFTSTYTATGLSDVVTFSMPPRIVQLPDSQGAYMQFDGAAAASPIPASLVILDGECPSPTQPDQVARVLYTLSNTVTGKVVASIPDGTLYHGRNVAIIRNDNKKAVFCAALTLSDSSFAPSPSRDASDAFLSAVFDVDASSITGTLTLQQVSDTEVIVVNSLAATGHDTLKWAIHELPLYNLPGATTSSLDPAVCALAGAVWDPSAAASPSLPVGALSARYGSISAGVPRAFSDISNLLSRRNFDGFTLVVASSAGDVLGCARIGAPALVGIATLPAGNGRVVFRQTEKGLTSNDALRTAFYIQVTDPDAGTDKVSGAVHQFGADSNSCAGLGAALYAADSVAAVLPAESALFASDASVDFSLLLGRSFALSKAGTGGDSLVACALIVNAAPSSTTTALTPANLRTAHATLLPNAGQINVPAITLQIEQPVSGTARPTRYFVKVDASALASDTVPAPWHAHVFPAPAASGAAGSNDCAATRGHMDTTFHGSAGVDESGDIAARAGPIPAVTAGKVAYFSFEDSVTSLDPADDSIVGRAITVHRSESESTRIACGTVLPVGTDALPADAETVAEEILDGSLKLRVLINDHKLPGYPASLVFDGSVANPNLSTSGAVSFAFHSYAVSQAGTDKVACSLGKTGRVFVPAGEKRSGDLVALGGLAPITLPAGSDTPVRVNYAGPVSSKFIFDVAEYSGRSIVLRSTYGAEACSNMPGEGNVMDTNPADKLVHHIRVAVVHSGARSAANVAYVPADALGRVVALFNERFADTFDSFYAAGQSVWSNEPWVTAAFAPASVTARAEGEYGVTVIIAGVPKDQSIGTTASAAADVVSAISHPDAVAQFRTAVGSAYSLKSVQQGPVATRSGACANGGKDNGETDTDCGNSAVTTCAACAVDQSCATDSDCASHRCSSSTFKCVKGGNSAASVSVSLGALVLVLAATMFV